MGNLKVSLKENSTSTQTTTTVASSVTSVTIVAANTTRRQVSVRNDSTKRLCLCLFTPATTATPFCLEKDEVWTFDMWTGAIYGIWDTGATGNAYITDES
jgi:hypothetical protein